LKSRLQEEEQAKTTLMGRIQRLTKLILVSTKNAMSSSIVERPNHRRMHSFGEDGVGFSEGYTSMCNNQLYALEFDLLMSRLLINVLFPDTNFQFLGMASKIINIICDN